MTEKEPLALTVEQAAALVLIGRDKMYQLTRRADFPAIRINRRIIIPRRKLEEWLEAHAGEALEV